MLYCRVTMTLVEAIVNKCLLEGNANNNKFSTQVNYHEFSTVMHSISQIHAKKKPNGIGAGAVSTVTSATINQHAFVDSSGEDSFLSNYINSLMPYLDELLQVFVLPLISY